MSEATANLHRELEAAPDEELLFELIETSFALRNEHGPVVGPYLLLVAAGARAELHRRRARANGGEPGPWPPVVVTTLGLDNDHESRALQLAAGRRLARLSRQPADATAHADRVHAAGRILTAALAVLEEVVEALDLAQQDPS